MTIGWEKLVGPVRRFALREGCTILQEKEKFGEWRLYYSYPADMDKDTVSVLEHAVDFCTLQSRATCIVCGDSAKLCTDGWILPLCEKHAKEEGRDWDEAQSVDGTWVTSRYKLTDEQIAEYKTRDLSIE